MATDNPRTKAIHIYTPDGGEYRVDIDRETVRTYEDGLSFALPGASFTVRRTVGELAARPVPRGPVLISTYADLTSLIRACADELGQEEAAAIAARLAAVANPNI